MNTATATVATTQAPRKSTTVTRAPNAGSIFRRHGHEGLHAEWRLRSWYKLVPRKWPEDADLREFMQSMTPPPSALVFEGCPQDEATHVSGSGVSGCLVPLSEIQVVGMVHWTTEELENAQKKAEADGELRRPLGL